MACFNLGATATATATAAATDGGLISSLIEVLLGKGKRLFPHVVVVPTPYSICVSTGAEGDG